MKGLAAISRLPESTPKMSIQEMAESDHLSKLIQEDPLEFVLLDEGFLIDIGFEPPTTMALAFRLGEADLQSPNALVNKQMKFVK